MRSLIGGELTRTLGFEKGRRQVISGRGGGKKKKGVGFREGRGTARHPEIVTSFSEKRGGGGRTPSYILDRKRAAAVTTAGKDLDYFFCRGGKGKTKGGRKTLDLSAFPRRREKKEAVGGGCTKPNIKMRNLSYRAKRGEERAFFSKRPKEKKNEKAGIITGHKKLTGHNANAFYEASQKEKGKERGGAALRSTCFHRGRKKGGASSDMKDRIMFRHSPPEG